MLTFTLNHPIITLIMFVVLIGGFCNIVKYFTNYQDKSENDNDCE